MLRLYIQAARGWNAGGLPLAESNSARQAAPARMGLTNAWTPGESAGQERENGSGQSQALGLRSFTSRGSVGKPLPCDWPSNWHSWPRGLTPNCTADREIGDSTRCARPAAALRRPSVPASPWSDGARFRACVLPPSTARDGASRALWRKAASRSASWGLAGPAAEN